MFFLELFFGLVLVLWGADLLINSAISIGRKFNLSEIFIGIIVIGFGTSLCELFVSIEAVIKGATELTLGNIIGSNIANILLVLGISSFVKAYKFPKINAFDNIIHLVVTIFFILICINSYLSKMWGIIFISFFLIYLSILLKNLNSVQSNDDDNKEKNTWLNNRILTSPILLGVPVIFFSFVVTMIGADITVLSAIEISKFFGISESVIGLTVIAIGTSFPEMAAGYAAMKKNRPNLVIGNIIGSNLYNILLIIGISTFFNNFKYNLTNIFNDLIFLLFCISIFFFMAIFRVIINKQISLSLILVYFSYIYFLYNSNF
ncbi:MAG: hypothetical protein CMP33_07855 [Rickettsiales bacterium]|nr:hypothetical protein [Rickettsiales bacterium]